MAEIVRGYSQLQARLHAVNGVGSTSLMRQFGLGTVREAKILVHRKTGNLGRSIRLASVTPTRATVVAGANYAAYVELGTRPHEITPKAARVLAWGGARRLTGSLRSGSKPTHFAMRVHHPGTKPYPYLIPGAKIAVQKGGAQAIVQAWNGGA